MKCTCSMGGSRGGVTGLDPPGKSQVAIGFLRNTDTDPRREATGPLIYRSPLRSNWTQTDPGRDSRRRPVSVPLGSNCFSREVHTALCEMLMTKKTLSGPLWQNFLDPSMCSTQGIGYGNFDLRWINDWMRCLYSTGIAMLLSDVFYHNARGSAK